MTYQFGMTTPTGEDVYHSDPQWLREMMLRAGPDFWNVGSGEAGIEFGRAQVSLIFSEQHGFSLSYRAAGEESSYVPWMLDGYGRPVGVSTGGTPFYLPEATFVPRELACEVVEEFCRTGQRSERITWLKGEDVRWDTQGGRALDPL